MTNPSWRDEVRAELSRLPDDLAGYQMLEPAAWFMAESELLQRLEAWGFALAQRDRRLGVAALVAFAQVGFPVAMANAAGREENCGFWDSEPHADGAPVEAQIARGAAWLDDPSEANVTAVKQGFDPTRQLNVWDEDLRPQSDKDNFFWYYEIGQCIAHAITGEGGDPGGESYDYWTPEQSVSRGLVIAVLGIRQGTGDQAALATLRAGV